MKEKRTILHAAKQKLFDTLSRGMKKFENLAPERLPHERKADPCSQLPISPDKCGWLLKLGPEDRLRVFKEAAKRYQIENKQEEMHSDYTSEELNARYRVDGSIYKLSDSEFEKLAVFVLRRDQSADMKSWALFTLGKNFEQAISSANPPLALSDINGLAAVIRKRNPLSEPEVIRVILGIIKQEKDKEAACEKLRGLLEHPSRQLRHSAMYELVRFSAVELRPSSVGWDGAGMMGSIIENLSPGDIKLLFGNGELNEFEARALARKLSVSLENLDAFRREFVKYWHTPGCASLVSQSIHNYCSAADLSEHDLLSVLGMIAKAKPGASEAEISSLRDNLEAVLLWDKDLNPVQQLYIKCVLNLFELRAANLRNGLVHRNDLALAKIAKDDFESENLRETAIDGIMSPDVRESLADHFEQSGKSAKTRKALGQ